MIKAAPIVLFCYNRLNHLKKTVNSLKKNKLSEFSELIIYSDGPKNDDDEIIQYSTDPKTIFERHENQVDAVIDCGFGSNVASTIVDCRESEPIIIRQGAGII